YLLSPPATTDIYTLSLHDALPISVLRAEQLRAAGDRRRRRRRSLRARREAVRGVEPRAGSVRRVPARAAPADSVHQRRARRAARDRKSTRLNSSHDQISYAVFCLK